MGKVNTTFREIPGPNFDSVTAGIPVPKRIFPKVSQGTFTARFLTDKENQEFQRMWIESEILRILRESGFSEEMLEKVEIDWEGTDRS